jgi:hypothetical protein
VAAVAISDGTGLINREPESTTAKHPSLFCAGRPSYTEPLMANEALINLLDWCKRERENLQCQFDALKAGRFKTHSNDGSGWKDTTQDSIERVEENIRELSKLIYKYEAARFER